MTLRAVSGLFSVALHGALVGVLLITPGGASLDEGSGESTFVVEQGFALEGVARLGEAEVEIAAIEAPPPVLATAAPVEEVKPIEEEDVQHVVGSEHGPEQQDVITEPEPEELEETPIEPEQVAVIEQTEISIDEQRAAGAKQDGGRATALSAYRGRLYSQISRKKVSPRSQRVGTVIVRFTVGQQGELLSSEVAKSSGHQNLDDAAIASIARAAPFPPMPSDASDGPLVVSVPFKFSVR